MADVTISYKNNEIATMNATGVKTLLTGDTFCEDDIVVAYTKPSAPAPTLQAKTNISPTTSSQTITADNGYDGLSSVQINSQLTTQAAQTKYPSTSDQTISSGRYLTGTQTFKAVTTSNLTADNIKKDVVVKVGDSANAGRIISVTGTYEGSGGGGTPVFSYTEITLTSSTNLVTINLDAMPAVVFGGLLPTSHYGDTISSGSDGKIYPLYFVITLQNSTFKNAQGGSKIDTTYNEAIVRNGLIYDGSQYGVNTNIKYTLTTSSTGATLQLKYSNTSNAAADDHYGIYVVGANIVT